MSLGDTNEAPMIMPSRLAIFIAIVLTLPLLLSGAIPDIPIIIFTGDIVLIGLIVYEGIVLKRSMVLIERHMPSKMSISRKTVISYRVVNRSAFALDVRVRDPYPPEFVGVPCVAETGVESEGEILFDIETTPRMRGRFTFPAPETTVGRRFGFARVRLPLTKDDRVVVYPDLQSLYEYDALHRSRNLSQIGIHRQRKISIGRDFEKLREYLPDDDFRDIHWNATARFNKPVTKVYQIEKSQDILLCLDCGRMMADSVGSLTALDRSVDAAIMIAYAALRQGDKAGLMIFADKVRHIDRPRGGISSINRLTKKLVGVEPQNVYVSYSSLAAAINVSQKKRALIFIFTDLNDVQLCHDLRDVIASISRRHVAVVISILNPSLQTIAESAPSSGDDIARIIAARELHDERRSRVKELQQRGAHIIESASDRLSIAAVNYYLEVKSRQLI